MGSFYNNRDSIPAWLQHASRVRIPTNAGVWERKRATYTETVQKSLSLELCLAHPSEGQNTHAQHSRKALLAPQGMDSEYGSSDLWQLPSGAWESTPRPLHAAQDSPERGGKEEVLLCRYERG